VVSPARYAPITPARNAGQPAAKVVVDSTLVQAVVEKNKERVTQLLNLGEDPNRCNLLPRLVMCRIPQDTHVKIADAIDDDDQQRIKEFARILVKNGAVLKDSEVQEFLRFQQDLEKQCQSISDVDQVFKNMARRWETTQNPFIKIINEEVTSRCCIPDNERAVCRFAAQLLPALQSPNKKEESKQQ
jgi:hypothetical protein